MTCINEIIFCLDQSASWSSLPLLWGSKALSLLLSLFIKRYIFSQYFCSNFLYRGVFRFISHIAEAFHCPLTPFYTFSRPLTVVWPISNLNNKYLNVGLFARTSSIRSGPPDKGARQERTDSAAATLCENYEFLTCVRERVRESEAL